MQPNIIGHVRSPLITRSDCPKSGIQALPPVWIELAPAYEQAATDLQIGDALIVLTWLHQADRSSLRCHPRGNRAVPKRGVFSTRSPDRPTPIGLHAVRVVDRKGLQLLVHPLEVIDGTPIIDIKPDNSLTPGQHEFPALINPDTGQAIIQAGRDGWQRKLFSGFNGNISQRQGQRMIITATGSAKGHLLPHDLTALDLDTGQNLTSIQPSSELAVHLEIYRQQPRAQAIAHTHPPKILALALCQGELLLDLPLFESKAFAAQLTRVPALPPGSSELAQAVGQASQDFAAIFLENHGLVCWAQSLTQAISLAEELESLADIALSCQGCGQ